MIDSSEMYSGGRGEPGARNAGWKEDGKSNLVVTAAIVETRPRKVKDRHIIAIKTPRTITGVLFIATRGLAAERRPLQTGDIMAGVLLGEKRARANSCS